MNKTYTGPSVHGGVVTVECPEWCVIDHEFWGDNADDLFHSPPDIELTLPRPSPAELRGQLVPPPLHAQLVVSNRDLRPAGALVSISVDEHRGRGVDLDPNGVDALLNELDEFRERLLALKGLMANIHAERRSSAAA